VQLLHGEAEQFDGLRRDARAAFGGLEMQGQPDKALLGAIVQIGPSPGSEPGQLSLISAFPQVSSW
jgi:hypothetical protein